MVLIRHSDNQIVIICDSLHKQYKMQTKNTKIYNNYIIYNKFTSWYHYYLLGVTDDDRWQLHGSRYKQETREPSERHRVDLFQVIYVRVAESAIPLLAL